MSNFKDDLLVALLDCGYGDLSIFDNCKYDFAEIVEDCQVNFGKIDINALAICMFRKGISEINAVIYDRIKELEGYDDDLYEEECEELDALKELDPYEDIESFHNYLDTNIWIHADKHAVYEKYLRTVLDDFESNTGFCLL